MTPKLKFVEGEKVLCFHGPLIYEAKALKSTVTKDKQIKYYIHYAGWNKNWDEWVPENRVLKYNEANVQRQKEVFKLHSTAAGKKKGTPKGKRSDSNNVSKDGGVSSGGSESRASTPSKEVNPPLSAPPTSNRLNRSKQATNVSTSLPKEGETPAKKDDDKDDATKDETNKEEIGLKRKRGGSTTGLNDKLSNTSTVTSVSGQCAPGTGTIRQEISVESEESFQSKVEIKIKIPDELKQCLADDWDAVTRQQKLLDIPAKITIQDIVDQYIASKKASKTTNTSKELAVIDVLQGVVEYFNVMIGSQLLYKFERTQYTDIVQKHPEIPFSQLYGGFHLLRLFVRLGSMLAFSALEEKSIQTLLGHLNDFLKFLVKNSATFFSMNNFINVSPEYHRNTQ